MAIRPVLKIGDPRLNQVALPVTVFDAKELHQLLDDMRDSMQALDGAGLAAPQIGINQRVVIFGTPANPRYPAQAAVPQTVLINPQIEVLTAEQAGLWEGCLSVPGMRGLVERPTHIRYQGYDQFGEKIDRTVDGFHAVVVQHECDHLDGILYPARIKDFSKFGFESELLGRDDYPEGVDS